MKNLNLEVNFLNDGYILGCNICTVGRSQYLLQNCQRTQFLKKYDLTTSCKRLFKEFD